MADQHDDDVRAWLAEDPAPKMPEDVAARVHAALERESQVRVDATAPPADSAPATVTPLRRPGRWKTPLLAAAGVVAVVAIGVPVVNQMSGSSSDDAGSAADQSSDSQAAGDSAEPSISGAQKEDGGDSAVPTLQLHRGSFASDVRAYVDSHQLESARATGGAASDVRCADGAPTSSAGLTARLDDDPAVILVAPARGGRSQVKAVVCDSGSARVAARATVR